MQSERKDRPVAEGSFSKTPFSHILVYLLNKRMGGTLEVQQGEKSATVYFQEGMPAKVRSTVPGRQLGRVLQIMKLITDEQLAACDQQIEKKGGLLGQILLSQGIIDTQTLIRALREQMLLKLTDIFVMTEADYQFYEHANRLSGFGSEEVFPVDPYAVLMAGFRAYGERLNLEASCEGLRGKWLTIDRPEQLRRFRPNHPEKALLRQILSAPQRYDVLIRVRRYHPKVVHATLHTLTLTQLLTVHDARPNVEAKPPRAVQEQHLDTIPPPPAEEGEDPEVVEKRRALLQKAAAIAGQNYYEMLGVEFGASVSDVRKAFFRLAREFHPDKVPISVSRELRDTIHYVFSNLAMAHATLIDGEAREEYEQAVREGEKRTSIAPLSEARIVQDTLSAETAFQKALVFVRRGQIDQAKEHIAHARKLCPSEGEYGALWAYVEWRQRRAGEPIDDLIEVLTKAITTNPRSEKSHLYLAQMLRSQGQEEEAIEHFDQVLRINPANLDAARELRIAHRRRHKGDADKRKGLFGRFFKDES